MINADFFEGPRLRETVGKRITQLIKARSFHCQLKIISITQRRPNFEYFEFWLLHRIRVAVPKATFDKREKRR